MIANRGEVAVRIARTAAEAGLRTCAVYPEERRALYDRLVSEAYGRGKALNAGSFELDGVIDPADTRAWIFEALRAAPPPRPKEAGKRPCVDVW